MDAAGDAFDKYINDESSDQLGQPQTEDGKQIESLVKAQANFLLSEEIVPQYDLPLAEVISNFYNANLVELREEIDAETTKEFLADLDQIRLVKLGAASEFNDQPENNKEGVEAAAAEFESEENKVQGIKSKHKPKISLMQLHNNKEGVEAAALAEIRKVKKIKVQGIKSKHKPKISLMQLQTTIRKELRAAACRIRK